LTHLSPLPVAELVAILKDRSAARRAYRRAPIRNAWTDPRLCKAALMEPRDGPRPRLPRR
jgi:hypothetical protein